MITHRFRFVKNFFKFFQTLSFFHSPLNSSYHRRPRSRLDYLTTLNLACQHLFSSFLTFFRCRTRRPAWCCAFRWSTLVPRRALAYISKSPLLCQHLFCFFSPLFSTSFSTTISATLSPLSTTISARHANSHGFTFIL